MVFGQCPSIVPAWDSSLPYTIPVDSDKPKLPNNFHPSRAFTPFIYCSYVSSSIFESRQPSVVKRTLPICSPLIEQDPYTGQPGTSSKTGRSNIICPRFSCWRAAPDSCKRILLTEITSGIVCPGMVAVCSSSR